MINKLLSIDNACYKQKKYNKLKEEMYLRNSSNAVWRKWKEVFKKYKIGDLFDLDTHMLFNQSSDFK